MKALILKNGADLDVQVLPEFITARSEAIAIAERVTKVEDELDQHDCAEALKALKALEKGAEDTRQAVKAPVLELGRKIDELAREAAKPMMPHRIRLSNMLARFTEEQRRKAEEAERKRQEEIARLAREKQEADEAERKRQEDLKATQEKARQAEEAAFLAEAKDPQAAQEAAEKAQQITKATEEQAAQERAEKDRQEAERLKALVSTKKKIKPPKLEGVSIRQVPKFEIVDIVQLYEQRPELVKLEPNAAAINAAIRKDPRLPIPGLKTWMESTAGVKV